jgi:hypothetical protein
MKARCSNPNHLHYKDYGGRGITVCDRWSDLFENFLADMGLRPDKKLTLERKDNDLGYFPANCHWAKRSDNQANRRCTIVLTLNGESHPLNVWAEKTGIYYMTLFGRHKAGWSDERTLTTPVKGRR